MRGGCGTIHRTERHGRALTSRMGWYVVRVVDLSGPIASSPQETLLWQRTDIEYLDHAGGAAEIEALFGVPSRLLRDGEG